MKLGKMDFMTSFKFLKTHRGMFILNKQIIFCSWLISSSFWNYGFPVASPFEDVIVTILSLFFIIIKEYLRCAHSSNLADLFLTMEMLSSTESGFTYR